MADPAIETERPAGSPGRPKDPGKRAAILAAARALFMEQGLGAVTMEAVAAAARVSKVTVYGHFGDKGALFGAVIANETERMAEALAAFEASGTRLADALVPFGTQLLTFLTSPSIRACDRLMTAEAHRHPDLAAQFFAAGPGRIWAALARLIEGAARRGEVAVTDPRRAAEDLVAVWLGMMIMELRLALRPAPEPAEIAERARHGVAMFMACHRPPA